MLVLYGLGMIIGLFIGIGLIVFIVWLGWQDNPRNPKNQVKEQEK